MPLEKLVRVIPEMFFYESAAFLLSFFRPTMFVPCLSHVIRSPRLKPRTSGPKEKTNLVREVRGSNPETS